MRAPRLAAVLLALAPLFLLSGLLAGFVNYQVLDGSRFAHHVDAMRSDPAVASQLGQAMTRRVLELNPDLIALRPLVEATATSVATSAVFTPVVETTARQTHEFFTHKNPGLLTVRLADFGSVLGGVLPTLAPNQPTRLPPGTDAVLARVGDQSVAAQTIRLTRAASLLAWLLPFLALLAFAGGVLLAADRLRAFARVGWGVIASAVGLTLIWLAVSLVAGSVDTTSLRGALVSAGWQQLAAPLLRVAVVTACAGALILGTANAWLPQLDVSRVAGSAWGWISGRPDRPVARVARIVVLLVLGAGLVFSPGQVLRGAAVFLGLLLLVSGAGEIARLAGVRRAASGPGPVRRQWLPIVSGVVAGGLLAGLIIVLAAPQDRETGTLISSPTSSACNGSVALCSRPYNGVSFAATHNSMAAADEPTWFIPEQPTGLIGQLDAGVRALLIDTWYGQQTDQRFRVATAPRSYQAALEQTKEDFGPDVVRSALRLRESFAGGVGPVRPYMCHGLCEIGATAFEPAMSGVRAWLQANPRDVVTIIIQDMVTPQDTVDVFRRAGLLPFVYTPVAGQPWPTLGEMIGSGRRLVVMMEEHGGGAAAPWLVPAFDWVQDTPYTNPTIADLSCELNRGEPDHPLLLLNNWLATFSALISSARRVNAYSQLWPYAGECEQERGQIPNFIAVNYYNEGDLFRVVNRLNGVR